MDLKILNSRLIGNKHVWLLQTAVVCFYSKLIAISLFSETKKKSLNPKYSIVYPSRGA